MGRIPGRTCKIFHNQKKKTCVNYKVLQKQIKAKKAEKSAPENLFKVAPQTDEKTRNGRPKKNEFKSKKDIKIG